MSKAGAANAKFLQLGKETVLKELGLSLLEAVVLQTMGVCGHFWFHLTMF